MYKEILSERVSEFFPVRYLLTIENVDVEVDE